MKVGAEHDVNGIDRHPGLGKSLQKRPVQAIEIGAPPLAAVAGTGIDEHGETVNSHHPTVARALEGHRLLAQEAVRQLSDHQ
nr:hypothetical protein [Rhodococcus sp. LB1]